MFKLKLLLAQSPRIPPSLLIYFIQPKGLQNTNPGPLPDSSNIPKYYLTAKKLPLSRFSHTKFQTVKVVKGPISLVTPPLLPSLLLIAKDFKSLIWGLGPWAPIIALRYPPRKPHFFLLGFKWLYSLVLVGQISIVFPIVPSSWSHCL